MFSSQSAELSLEAPCRVVSSVHADLVDNRFLVGSCSVRDDNYLYACRFHSDVNETGLDASFYHPTGPVQSIACSPSNVSLVATSSQLQNNATLWKLDSTAMQETGGLRYNDTDEAVSVSVSQNTLSQESSGSRNNGSGSNVLESAPKAVMEAQTVLTTDSGKPVSHLAWRQPCLETDVTLGASSAGDLLTVDQLGNVQQWDVEFEQAVAGRTYPNAHETSHLHMSPRVAWDPHAGGAAAAVAVGTRRVSIFDWRTDQSIPVGTTSSFLAHRSGAVVDLDYNPNKPFVLATAGTDGLLQFWDLRSAQQPILTCRGGHSHWVSNVKYNPFHDQLVLSTGTDSLANLWRVSTISSAPLLEDKHADRRVEKFEHAADACYGAAWGAADAWIYTTVGYEGKVVVHHVPSKEKYKILL